MMNDNMSTYLSGRFGMDMTIVKASIYKKHWVNIDPETGKVRGEGERYLTLVACVPTVEFLTTVELYGKTDKRPNTNGVFVATIGSTEGLIITNSRVGLRTYQDHLEDIGWKWIQTVPKSKGKSWEWVQRKALWLINHQNALKPQMQENWYILKNSLQEMAESHDNTEDRQETLRVIMDMMEVIENP